MHRPFSGAQPHPQLSAPLAREGAVCREETVATAVRAAGHWAAMATLQGRSRGWLRKAGCGPVSFVNISAGQWAVSPVLSSSRMSPIAQMRELGHLLRRAELWTELGPSSGLRGPKLQPSPGWGPAPKVLSQGPPGILPSSPRDTSHFSSARRLSSPPAKPPALGAAGGQSGVRLCSKLQANLHPSLATPAWGMHGACVPAVSQLQGSQPDGVQQGPDQHLEPKEPGIEEKVVFLKSP